MIRCPRCGGNVLPDWEDGSKCLQCGFIPPLALTLSDALVRDRNRNIHCERPLLPKRIKRYGLHINKEGDY